MLAHITGGGTKYYKVEFDKDGAHWEVQVDAIGGNVVSGMSTTDSHQTTYDANGNEQTTIEI